MKVARAPRRVVLLFLTSLAYICLAISASGAPEVNPESPPPQASQSDGGHAAIADEVRPEAVPAPDRPTLDTTGDAPPAQADNMRDLLVKIFSALIGLALLIGIVIALRDGAAR